MLDGLRHEAMPYRGESGFVTACLDVVRDGLDQDHRLIVLAAAEKLAAVTDALGPDAADVTLVAIDEHGRNPSRITTILNTFQSGGDGRHCLGVCESVFASRSPAALAEAQLSEFLLNDERVSAWPLTLVCLYDSDTLPAAALDVMRQSHAVVRGQDTNPEFLPDHAATLLAAALDPPPASAPLIDVDADTLSLMRDFVRANAVRAALGADRVDDLVLAANEVVTNSIRYAGGRARLAMWTTGIGAVCDVLDTGHVSDRFAGRFAPPPGATSGRGLWLAHHLCDLVQFRTTPEGTTVRLHVDR